MAYDDSELALYIDNDGELYEKYRRPIYVKLADAMAGGSYSHARAVKEFLALADAGAKKFQREVTARYFTSDEKRDYAEGAAKYFETEWSLGNFRDFATEAQKWNPGSIPMLGAQPITNPWEVRSATGLEGVFADEDDARFHADELRRSGVTNVEVARRRRGGPLARMRGEASTEHGNPSDRLFAGIYPTGIVYADKAREVDGDYMRVAFLPYNTLRLQWSPGNHPADIIEAIEHDAGAIIERRGQPFEISESGQTVILGGTAAARPPGAPPQYHVPQGRPPGVPNPGPRVLREKWGDSSEIVVEHQRYGISAWLESKRGGGRVPISFGAERPDTLREAMELAKKFLRGVYGKSNPAGLTAKGERMYEHIKKTYQQVGDIRAKEIAARTVASRAKHSPGIMKKR